MDAVVNGSYQEESRSSIIRKALRAFLPKLEELYGIQVEDQPTIEETQSVSAEADAATHETKQPRS
jgi:hypothetical protein